MHPVPPTLSIKAASGKDIRPKASALSRRVLRLIALGYVVCLAISMQAGTIDWSNLASTSVWSLGTNWVGLAAPANSLTADIARFDQTSYLAQPNAGTTSINGIRIGDGTTATATLTLTSTALSVGSSGITMFANAGTATFTGGSVKIGADQNWANNSSNLLTINSNVTNSGNTTPFTLTLNGSGTGGTTVAGIISNGGTTGTTALVVNTTAGTTTLSGINTYTGGTTLTAGTLKLSGSGTLGGTSGTLTVNAGTLNLNGTNQSVGNFTGSGGTILNNGTGTNVTLTIGTGDGTGGNYSGVIADHTSGTGTVALTKTGTGTITMSGANTYTGATTVNTGTLLINGNQASASGAVTVSNSGTLLGGTGTIGGAVTINGPAKVTAATNGTTGALTLSSGLSLSGTSGNLATYLVDLTASASDKLSITGNLNLSTLFDQISFQGTTGAASYQLITYTGTLTGTFDTVTNLPSGYVLQYNTGEIDLVVVPEPSTWFTAALALGAIGFSQRKRLRSMLKKTLGLQDYGQQDQESF